MQLIELIELTNNLFFNDSAGWRVIQSKQNELLTLLKPATDINKIDYKIINSLIDAYKIKGNSPATINSKLAYLSKILNYAFKINKLKNKPYIPTLKQKAAKDVYLTKTDKVKILLWCRHNSRELYRIILIGLYTGLRINNILSLSSSMYQDNKLYIYDKKTNKNFILPVSSKIKYILTNFSEFSLNYQQCYYIFNLMKQQLKLDNRITIHTLRHTFGSDLVNQNITLPVIKTLMNHKQINTTMRYLHVNTTQLTEAINML